MNDYVGRAFGWEVKGVDRNPVSIEICRRMGIEDVKELDWERGGFVEDRVRLIMFCDVLEHFVRPDDALRKAHSCLHKGGLIFATTPDVASIWAKILRRRWWHYHIDHLWYFSHKTLRRLAENAGFEVLECGPTKKRFALRYIVSILANSERRVAGKWISRNLFDKLPKWMLAMRFPPVSEGLTLIARKIDR